jgi:hypothetical protein
VADEKEVYRLYDNKERAFVNMKEYKSESSANKAAESRNQGFGSSRYSAEKYSDVVSRNTPKSGGGGSGGSASDTREMQLGAELDPKAMMKREGYKKGGAVKSASSRADGCAQRGKTRGMMK